MPEALTEPIPPHRVAMRGTLAAPVRCAIDAQRASTCREFTEGDERCQEARRRHGRALRHHNPASAAAPTP